MQAKIIERQKQIELQEQENLRVQRKLEATIKKQAEAKELLALTIHTGTIWRASLRMKSVKKLMSKLIFRSYSTKAMKFIV